MEKGTIELLGLAFRMLIRYWARDTTVAGENFIEFEQFAQTCGLSIWEAKKFGRTMEEYIDVVAEDFIKEVGRELEDKERINEIIKQIKNDISILDVNNNQLRIAMGNPVELQNLIMSQSQEERKIWNRKEKGIYTNCVRYISKVSIEFASKLPEFTSSALKVVIGRQEEYHKELINILTDIHSMTSVIKSIDIAYREYESLYRDMLIRRYSKVELIGTSIRNKNVTKYDISSSYVELNCVSEYESESEIEISQVFSHGNIVWIKGEAGSGKSTFLQWVAVCAAKADYDKIKNIENTIPIVIQLRNTEWPIDLYASVNKITKSYGKNCPDGWIAEMLKQKRIILLFDGLDEVSSQKREDTYNFIEDIVEQYPEIKILLTARNSVNDYSDYDNVCYEIMPMKMDNIKKFILYWHKSVLWRDAVVKDKEIDRLQHNLILKIIDNSPLKALAKNPLLCAMICALNFVNNEQLPNEKMELYDKCCEMLMDARDTQRKIDNSMYKNIPQMDYSKKRVVLEELAYWMLEGGESLVDKTNVIGFFRHLINDTRIFSHEEKNYSEVEILNFFIERSGLIREPEEGKIDFIHKTFMEFLAVKVVCRKCSWNVLIKEACNENWKETIIMSFREMSKENVEYVLNKMLLEGDFRNDDRYYLMASLGASNAVFLGNNEIKKKIDDHIKSVIPPKYNKIFELAQAESYLLPFLKDSEKYSDDERERCLELLDYLKMEEAIPDILSYIIGNGNADVKRQALDILCEYGEGVLEEYNVREELLTAMIESINNGELSTYETMLNMINDIDISSQKRSALEKVNILEIFFGTSPDNLYYDQMEFLWYLNNCEKLILRGEVKKIDFLNKFSCITDLIIDSVGDLSKVLQYLSTLKNLVNVRYLCINAEKIDYLCEYDFRYMKNLEELEIYCPHKKLELDFEGFKSFSKLKKVTVKVDYFLKEEMLKKVEEWSGDDTECNFIIEESSV